MGGLDEMSMLIGELKRGQEDTTRILSELRVEMREEFLDLRERGCVLGRDHSKRLDELEAMPKKVVASISVAVGTMTAAVVELVKALAS